MAKLFLQNKPNPTTVEQPAEDQPQSKNGLPFCKNKPNSQPEQMNEDEAPNDKTQKMQNKANWEHAQTTVNKTTESSYDKKTPAEVEKGIDTDSEYMRALYKRMPIAMEALYGKRSNSTE